MFVFEYFVNKRKKNFSTIFLQVLPTVLMLALEFTVQLDRLMMFIQKTGMITENSPVEKCPKERDLERPWEPSPGED